MYVPEGLHSQKVAYTWKINSSALVGRSTAPHPHSWLWRPQSLGRSGSTTVQYRRCTNHIASSSLIVTHTRCGQSATHAPAPFKRPLSRYIFHTPQRDGLDTVPPDGRHTHGCPAPTGATAGRGNGHEQRLRPIGAPITVTRQKSLPTDSVPIRHPHGGPPPRRAPVAGRRVSARARTVRGPPTRRLGRLKKVTYGCTSGPKLWASYVHRWAPPLLCASVARFFPPLLVFTLEIDCFSGPRT